MFFQDPTRLEVPDLKLQAGELGLEAAVGGAPVFDAPQPADEPRRLIDVEVAGR